MSFQDRFKTKIQSEKVFDFNLAQPKILKRTEFDGVRYYYTPEGNLYPSITTILKESKTKTEKASLENWRNLPWIGPAEADRITGQAANRGTQLHSLIEHYLKGDNVEFPNPFVLGLFKQLRPFLDKNVSNIMGLEFPLYSDTLKIAGTADLLCKWNGINSIVDFKTARKEKLNEDYIKHYFFQCCFYSMAYTELYGIEIPQIVILMAQEGCEEQIFIKERKDYSDKTIKLINKNIGKFSHIISNKSSS